MHIQELIARIFILNSFIYEIGFPIKTNIGSERLLFCLTANFPLFDIEIEDPFNISLKVCFSVGTFSYSNLSFPII